MLIFTQNKIPKQKIRGVRGGRLASKMPKFNLCINGIIRAGDSADAKMYLSELLTDMHMSLPMNIRPVEAFEISVCEIEE